MQEQQMMAKENLKYNIADYITWAFDQNEGTLGQIEDLTKSIVIPGHKMKDNYKNSIVWLFRKAQKLEELEGQYQIIPNQTYIIRHIFLYLLILIHYNQDHQIDILSLMKSIGIIIKKNKFILIIETSTTISQQQYNREEIIQQLHINKNDYELLIKCWAQLKEQKYEQCLNILNQNNQFNILVSTINFQLNFEQEKLLKQKQKQLEERAKRKKKEKEKQIEEKLIQSKQAKTLQKSLKISSQKKQQLKILPNGNIIRSKLWQNQNLPALPINYKSEIIQFRKSQFTLNQLFSDNDIIIYTGQVDELYQPNSYGKMSDKAMKLIYQGGFKNGLFNGNGEIIKQNQLHYSGQFKNGQKHGMFYRLQEQQNQPSNIYLKGEYYQDKRQGIFEEYKLESIGNKLQFVKFGNNQYKFFNGQQVKLDTDIMRLSINKINPSIALFSFGEFGVNNFLLATLQPGRWINSNIIDIIIDQCINLQAQINPKIFDNNIFINCSLFQDLFGSIIVEDAEINYKKFKEILCKIEKPRVQRIFFYLNLDRGHFLSVVYENSKLYLVDSQTDPRGALLFQIKKLLKYFQIQVQDSWETNFEVSQQENGYDCGVFTIYYMSQMIKQIKNPIEKMKIKNIFQISRKEINLTRNKINQFFLGQGTAEFGM